MAIYCIGGLYVDIAPVYCELADRAMPFICEEERKADIILDMSADEILKRAEVYGFSLPMAEYQLSCELFCKEVLRFSSFVLHASAVLLEGNVYLFSAPSGVGKSTHAEIWKRCFNARIINDDKPLIRLEAGILTAYGTPWCGSGFERLNESGVLKALFFIKRAEQNKAYKLALDKALYLLLESTYRPAENSDMNCLINTLDEFLNKVNVYGLECNMEDVAAKLAFATANAND